MSQRGVTLIETVVAVGLFAIAMAGVSQFMTDQIRMSSDNYLTTVGYGLAEEEFERMRTLDYDDMVAGSRTVAKGSVTFTVATTVQNNNPSPNMKAITVAVSWAGPGGAKNVTVQSVYTAVKR